jgi:preprotein translocase SecE subunit
MGLVQYLKDTRGELHHVAWPTRVQTIIFTTLVIIISILVSLYLGFFDFLFTTGLGKAVGTLPTDQMPMIDVSDITTTTEPVGTTTNQ